VKALDAMTTDVVAVHPDTGYKELVEQLVAHDISGVPVVNDDGRLLGVVTEADVLSRTGYDGERRRALAILADVLSAREHHWATKALAWTAADLMTRDVVTCAPDDDVRAAARRMLDHGVTRLPVVDDERVVGVLARQDVLRTLVRPDREVAADVARMLATAANRPDELRVRSSVVDGKVVLTGDVRYPEDIGIVVAMVHDVAGVIGVEDHLHAREPAPRQAPPPPLSWITRTR
jgi:CBS domain-containing protein